MITAKQCSEMCEFDSCMMSGVCQNHNGRRDRALIDICDRCKVTSLEGGWSTIDLMIYHDNGHVWPGFAGEPCDYPYGGSDF